MPSAPVSIDVALRNAEAVPPADLVRARDLAGAILGHVGIRIHWADAPGAIQVRFLPAPPAGLHGDATGFAVLSPVNYAAVCWSAVVKTARDLSVETWTVLGATIAHELGHLLLQSKTHSSGVMSYRLDLPQLRAAGRGELRFEPGDARRIREAAIAANRP